MKLLRELVNAFITIVLAMLVVVAGLSLIVGFAWCMGWVMALLWNSVVAYLMPLPQISPWQGLGLLIILNLLGGLIHGENKKKDKS